MPKLDTHLSAWTCALLQSSALASAKSLLRQHTTSSTPDPEAPTEDSTSDRSSDDDGSSFYSDESLLDDDEESFSDSAETAGSIDEVLEAAASEQVRSQRPPPVRQVLWIPAARLMWTKMAGPRQLSLAGAEVSCGASAGRREKETGTSP